MVSREPMRAFFICWCQTEQKKYSNFILSHFLQTSEFFKSKSGSGWIFIFGNLPLEAGILSGNMLHRKYFFVFFGCIFHVFSCDPFQPPFSSVGMTNNAVECRTMRGPSEGLISPAQVHPSSGIASRREAVGEKSRGLK